MKTKDTWKGYLTALFFLTILTACAATTPEPTPIPPTPTEVPPTVTPVPPTEIPKPASCDEVDGNCLEITFDGEYCSFDGDPVYKSGLMTFIYISNIDDLAFLAIGKHSGSENLQDTADYFGPEPGYKAWPAWVDVFNTIDVSANQIDTWQDDLTPGIYPLACYHKNGQKTFYGDGFTVEN